MHPSSNRRWDSHRGWLWFLVWLLPIATTLGLVIGDREPDSPLGLGFVSFAGPAVAVLGLLFAFRVGVAAALGASAALSVHLALIAKIAPDPVDFIWTYSVTFLGALVGCLFVVAYRARLTAVRPNAAMLRSGVLVLAPAMMILGVLFLR